MVASANAVVDPVAMMIKVLYAFIADIAMLAATGHYDLAVRAKMFRFIFSQ